MFKIRKYKLCDLIKSNIDINEDNIYIIIDVVEFYDENLNDNKVEYGVMQIYPISMHSPHSILESENSSLHAIDGSDLAMRTHRDIRDCRIEKGYNGVPDFVKMLNTDMKSRKVYLSEVSIGLENNKTNTGVTKKEKAGKIKVNHTKNKDGSSKRESIKPFPLNTIDECLDAMNSAVLLHGMFGDAKYLEMKERALAKLIELTS